MAEVNHDELLKGSIEDIKGKFADFDDDTLKAIATAEGKGAKRAGLLSAIESEQGSRKLTTRAAELQESAKGEGVTLHTDADVQKLVDERMAGEQAALAEQVKTLEQQLATAKKRVSPAKAVKAEAPRKLSLTGEAGDDQPLRVAFTGDDDMTVADLPELEFGEGDFEVDRSGGGVILTQPIEFPEGASRTPIRKVWLVGANGKAAAVAPLVNPLPVGGGQRATIPAKFLRFVREGEQGAGDGPKV
jgi:hypothetical protein